MNDAFPWAYDEYDTYAGLIVTRLRDGADPAEIARFLQEFEYPSSIKWWRERSLK